MAKYKLNHSEFLEHWQDQFDFIEDSIELFDKGNEKEAKRIATHLRVLFHQTDKSQSLLNLLRIPIIFYSSGGLYTPSNLLSSWPLLSMSCNEQGLFYQAMLENSGRAFFMNFNDWWNEIIFDDKSNVFTRRDIVLFIANQDGGAHVDPHMRESNAKLVKYNSLGWTDGDGNSPQNNPSYQAIRAIANEVIISYNLFKMGMKSRTKQTDRTFEMRFIDSERRYKWSTTEINFSEETRLIVDEHRVDARKLYIQEFSNGVRREYIG